MIDNESVHWEVRDSDGDDLNGGGFSADYSGIDRTYPTSSVENLTNISINSTSLTCDYTFVANDQGNVVALNDGSTIERRLITSVSGGVATLDAAPAITPTSGRLGGSLYGVCEGFEALNHGQKLWIKKRSIGKYMIDRQVTRNNMPGDAVIGIYGGLHNKRPTVIEGYENIRGDGDLGTAQLEFDTSVTTSWTVLFSHSNDNARSVVFKFLDVDGRSDGDAGHIFWISRDENLCYKCIARNPSSWGFSCATTQCLALRDIDSSRSGSGFSSHAHFGSVARQLDRGFGNCYCPYQCIAINCNKGFDSNQRATFGCLAYQCNWGFEPDRFGGFFIGCLNVLSSSGGFRYNDFSERGIAYGCGSYTTQGVDIDGDFASTVNPGGITILSQNPLVDPDNGDFSLTAQARQEVIDLVTLPSISSPIPVGCIGDFGGEALANNVTIGVPF